MIAEIKTDTIVLFVMKGFIVIKRNDIMKVGDIIINRAAEKINLNLMIVTDIGRPDNLIKTEYINRKGTEPYNLIHKSHLCYPKEFGMSVGTDARTSQH